MPWRQSQVSEERMKFVAESKTDTWSMTDLCTAFGIAPKTGYKYLSRFEAEGLDGLKDRSRAPHHHPNETAPEVVKLIVKARRKYPKWGPRKLLGWLKGQDADVKLPSVSTAGDILKRHGLVEPRKRRRTSTPSSQPLAAATHPNGVWCTDYKGWFRTQDGARCDPLTITDGFSRYLLTCHVVPRPDHLHTQRLFERAFREYGLPDAIRSDNGAPFASTAIGGLSLLSVWWVKLGIRLERIEPGKPEQNGRHERMHLTLKQATALPPRLNLRAQQRSFDAFRREFNFERPHEALANQTPAEHYRPSARQYPSKLPAVEYPGHFIVRSVHTGGRIKWRGELLYVSEVLMGEHVGLEWTSERCLSMHFGPIMLGLLDDASLRILPNRRLTRMDKEAS